MLPESGQVGSEALSMMVHCLVPGGSTAAKDKGAKAPLNDPGEPTTMVV